MRVLVSGASGFIGGRLCQYLSANGITVRAFHRATSNLRQIEGLPGIEHAIGDITQRDSVRRALKGVDVVFHTAALMGNNDNPGQLYTVTVEGTKIFAQAALEAGVKRFVHTSSAAALGVAECLPYSPGNLSPCLIDENHTWNLLPNLWPYGYAKYLAEIEIQKAIAKGLDAVIVNPSVVFGAGDLYRKSSSIVVQIARQRIPFMVTGGLNAVHIQDVVEGHLAAMERGKKGERYILGGSNLTHRELIIKISQIAGVPPPAITLPAGIIRPLGRFLGTFQAFIALPLALSEIQLVGRNFYYTNIKSITELGLPFPRPIESAIEEALTWFKG